MTMTEQEKYECFGIPAHVWIDDAGPALPKPAGWWRRSWVHREAAVLGAEAPPSPQVDTLC